MFHVKLTPEQVALIEQIRQVNLEFDPDFSVSDAISAALNLYVGLVLME